MGVDSGRDLQGQESPVPSDLDVRPELLEAVAADNASSSRWHMTRIVMCPDHLSLRTIQRTPSVSAFASTTSPDARPRANQGMLSMRYSSPPSGSAQSPSLSTGGQPCSSGVRWKRTFTWVTASLTTPM